MWRARHFKRLLELIDHLPGDTYYAQAVASDPTHAEMMAKEQGRSRDWAPPMATWDQHCELLATLNDKVEQLFLATIAANSKPGSAKPKFQPYPRPRTMLSKAKRNSARQKHQALVARVLPKE